MKDIYSHISREWRKERLRNGNFIRDNTFDRTAKKKKIKEKRGERKNISKEKEVGREIGETSLELVRDNSFLSAPNVKRDKNAFEISFEFNQWSKSTLDLPWPRGEEELIFDADIREEVYAFTCTWIRRKWSDKNGRRGRRRREGVLCLSKGGTNERSSMRLMNISRGVAPRIYRHPLRSSTLAPFPLWESCLGIRFFFLDFWKKERKDMNSFCIFLYIEY